ncbi:hypothetical protein [Streptomyces sp. NPDC093544]|jgi:hypothetical protein|uniref:hypothetical protein n=1 Tax=Streptomyces sp. NPDC093544 TaxID=3155200 RepID=UPI00341FB2E1
MRTAGTPWTRTALGFGIGLTLLTGGLVTACGESGATDGTNNGTTDGTTAGAAQTSAHPNSPTPSPSSTPPEDLCAQLVAHWSREALDQDTYGDYQSMGLSNGQYEILMKVVDAARAEKKRKDTEAAEQLIDRRARELCAERYRDGAPSGGPWQ